MPEAALSGADLLCAGLLRSGPVLRAAQLLRPRAELLRSASELLLPAAELLRSASGLLLLPVDLLRGSQASLRSVRLAAEVLLAASEVLRAGVLCRVLPAAELRSSSVLPADLRRSELLRPGVPLRAPGRV